MSGIMKQFGQLKSVVLRAIGRTEFEQSAEGKAVLTSVDEEKLKAAFTPAFLEQFKAGLNTEGAVQEQEAAANLVMEQLKKDHSEKMTEMVNQVNAAKQRADDLESANLALKESVDILSVSSENDVPAERLHIGVIGAGKKAWFGEHGVKLPKSFHNEMASEYLKGDTGKAMGASTSSFGSSAIPGMGGNTINVDEVASEFGTYLSQLAIRLEILQKLTAKTESQNFMTTKQAITEWRATTALITSVVQQYVAKWTPLGSSSFTPLTIKNRHHKVNLEIVPDDINDSWLSWLYDEQVTPDQMPVTRFIIEKLLRPRIEADIELLMIATGVYEELGSTNEGDAGQATGKNMDGFVTILKAESLSVSTKMNFFDPSTVIDSFTAITKDNIVDVIEGYVDYVEEVAPLYAKAGLNIFIDPVLYKWYGRKYRDLYPTTKNADGTKTDVDSSNFKLIALESMRNTGVFVSTPQDNFIRLIHKNAAGGETKLWMQTQNYTVKVFAEFWLGVGFAMAELVFGYVPDPAASGSGN
jgi:hypothetical protein